MATWLRAPGDIAAEVLMASQNFSGAFLLMEGPSDSKFWAPRAPWPNQLVIGSGRTSIEGAIGILGKAAFANAVAVVDDDWDWAIGKPATSKNIVKTEPRDLEGILLRSGALTKILAEYASGDAVKGIEATEGCTLRGCLTNRAAPFGRIHIVNALGPQREIRRLKPQRFCDRATWSYDMAAAEAEAVRLGVAPDVPTLRARAAAVVAPDAWHLCRGHDLVDILCGGLLSVLGGRGVSNPEIEKLLRSGIEQHELQQTRVWRELEAWMRATGWGV